VSHVRQLCRHQAVDIVGAKEDRCNQGDQVPCLSRTLVLPNEAVIVVRVHLPNLSTASDMENARERIQTELQRLKVKKKKIDKQLEKLRTLTSRPTYLTTAPKNVQELQHLKMNELRADAIDLENVANTLSGFQIL
jgi:valyl-tRNA synthetase